ncbi:hypothetical protein DAI22_09g002266 [Oryza sativa Japonica Group]|nr:hypothetical protein DAI22_09g002266 [Oryza sativa Japonica Group]
MTAPVLLVPPDRTSPLEPSGGSPDDHSQRRSPPRPKPHPHLSPPPPNPLSAPQDRISPPKPIALLQGRLELLRDK